MGRRGKNSGGKNDSYGSKQGGLLNKIRNYKHVSEPNTTVFRPQVYVRRAFPALDQMMISRQVDDRIEVHRGVDFVNTLPQPVKVNGNISLSSRCDNFEEDIDESFSSGRYLRAALESKCRCLDQLVENTCISLNRGDSREEEGEEEQPTTAPTTTTTTLKGSKTNRSCGVKSLSVLCIQQLGSDLATDWAEEGDAAALGGLCSESLKPELTTILSIAAARAGAISRQTLPAVANPHCEVLCFGGESKAGSGLTFEDVGALVRSLKQSAQSSTAPETWEVHTLPSHLSGVPQVDFGELRGPRAVYLFDVLFVSDADLGAFQTMSTGLRELHMYSFTSSPMSVPSFSQNKNSSSRSSSSTASSYRHHEYHERCVVVFSELFLSSHAHDFLNVLTLDHCAFGITTSGLRTIGHLIAEARHNSSSSSSDGGGGVGDSKGDLVTGNGLACLSTITLRGLRHDGRGGHTEMALAEISSFYSAYLGISLTCSIY
jgi:hypothetical protein